MRQDRDELDRAFTRRSFVLGAGGACVFGALITRLHYLQVVKAQDYRTLSDNNRFNLRVTVPMRGRILDRTGVALASNRQDFRVFIVPERVADLDGTLDRIAHHIPLSEGTRERIRKEVKQKRSFASILIDEHLSWQSFTALNLDLPALPGVIPLSGENRYYPESGLFSHIIGYVGTPDPADIEDEKDPLLRQPTFQIGKTGVEEAVDLRVRGAAGRLKVEVNAFGRVVREWPELSQPAVAGQDVYVTLDASLTEFAAKEFADESGGAALMDANTGELRVLLSMPSFDANQFVNGLTREDMLRLNSDEKRPQFNKVLGGGYPPASTFKMIVALAGLEAGLIRPEETVFCSGKTPLGGRLFHCWKRPGHGAMNLKDSIMQSCDVYYYQMGERIGIDRIKAMALRMGLGQTFDLGIKGQTAGLLPDDAWKRKRMNDAWRPGDTYNASIGQGFVLATPLQLAVAAARFANAKQAVTPFLIIDEKTPTFAPLDIDPEHMAIVRDAMFGVTSLPGGSAYRVNPFGIEGVTMAGKTGTGQVRGITMAERAAGLVPLNETPWKYRDHSIFMGFAPFENPRFAAAAIIEHGGAGSKKAASLVRNLLGEALRRDGIVEARAGSALASSPSSEG